MRHLILALLLAASASFAQTATAITGQGIVTEQRIGWGASMSQSLYVTSTGFFRDSGAAGNRVAFDTSTSSVGGPGACSQTIVMRTGSGIVPQSYSQTSLRMRATDPVQAGIQVYLAFRWRNPATSDSGWVIPSRNRVYDSSYVYMTLTSPTLTTSYQTWWMNGFAAGQDVRVCVARTASGPGAADTVALSNNWWRAW